MRKLAIYFGIAAALFAVLYVLNGQSTIGTFGAHKNNVYGIAPDKLHPETLKLLDDPNYRNIILPDELDRTISAKQSVIVYYFASTCPHCKQTTPVLMPIAKSVGADVKQFNLEEFPDGWKKYGIRYTPTLVYYRDGKEAERIEGGIPDSSGGEGIKPDTFKSFLQKNKP